MTSDPRANVIVAVDTAVAHLSEALDELDRMPRGDPVAVGFVAHALNNCLSVSDATLNLLSHALRDHPHAREHLRERSPARQFDADVAIPAQVARARQHEIPEPAQPRKRFPPPAFALGENVLLQALTL